MADSDQTSVQSKDAENGRVPCCLYWSVEDVADFVDRIGFPYYKDCFRSNFVNGRKMFLMTQSNLPRIGITNFADVKVITAALKKELGVAIDDCSRRIYLPPYDDIGLYLEAKTRTGKTVDGMYFEQFAKQYEGRVWQPPLANEALLISR